MIQIKKKNGSLQEFDIKKLKKGIRNAMKNGSGEYFPRLIDAICNEIKEGASENEILLGEDIDKLVIKRLRDYGQSDTATEYDRYKTLKYYKKSKGIVDNEIEGLLGGTNAKVIDENSNKDSKLLSTQRDLISGIVSRDYAERKMIPIDLLQAHQNGLIHLHDTDYMIQTSMFNCQLINLKDMLQNGTVINGKMIEKPHSIQTAATIATQISLSVANSQFGGQTFTLSHLAPFVRLSYEGYIADLIKDYKAAGKEPDMDLIKAQADRMTRKEVKSAVQTIQFQENTFSSGNGQTPFVSLFLYVSEEPEYKKETALLIEETLNLRYLGMKNAEGVYVTPAFPKLLYCLDEDNVPEDSEYRYLTDLAVKCAPKRLNPDFISAKIMKRNYEGNVFPCMGCVDKEEVITYKVDGQVITEGFGRAWDRLGEKFEVKLQDNMVDEYMDLTGVDIFDSTNKSFVQCHRIIKNSDKQDWVKIRMTGGRSLECTLDHPLAVIGKGRTLVKDIRIGDQIEHTNISYEGTKKTENLESIWALGAMLGSNVDYFTKTISVRVKKSNADVVERLKWYLITHNLESRIGQWTVNGDVYSEVKLECTIDTAKVRDAFIKRLSDIYQGSHKEYRIIPANIFELDKDGRMAFLAGLIDTRGSFFENKKGTIFVKLSGLSINREQTCQILNLVNSLGLKGEISWDTVGNTVVQNVIFKYIPELLDEAITSKVEIEPSHVLDYEYESLADNEYCTVVDIEKLDTMGKYSYDVTTASDRFDVSGIASHNCRSFLSPWKDENGNYKFYGRFNRGVCTINLVDVALSAKKDIKRFWEILDERLDLVKRALQFRTEQMRGSTSDVSPIHWQNGSVARLKPGEKIDKYLDSGFSTVSLGYIGVFEMCMAMYGVSNTTEQGEKFAKEVIGYLGDVAKSWKSEPGLAGASLYGTPSESLCYKFAQKTAKRFGVIKDITDKDWFTNSYHVCVYEPIDAFSKLKFEAQFQNVSTGGACQYVEVPNMSDNLEALGQIVDFIYDNVQYAEINTRCGDVCGNCGFQGEIQTDKNGTWTCPSCGCQDRNKLTVVRRTCGYIGSNFWNKGKTEEISKRVYHI